MDNTPSKTGIVLYSRSGHSRRLAEKLADTLDATIIELNAPDYKGTFGFMQAGYSSLRQTCALAPQSFSSLSDYDRIILCGPVWTSYPAAPLRGLLRSDITLPESVSLFLTSGGTAPAIQAFNAAQADMGHALTAKASLGNSEEGTLQEDHIIKAFLQELNATGDWNHSDPSAVRLHTL